MRWRAESLEFRAPSAYLARRYRRCQDPVMAKANPVQFINEVRSEVAKVVWPTRREVVLTTIMVFIMAALTATFFSLVDFGIRSGLSAVLNAFG
jgi:preprotein translocase subunit SecE